MQMHTSSTCWYCTTPKYIRSNATIRIPPPYHINVKWNRIVLKSDCSARILHFAFREIDSQIMIVLRFRGSENCHSCIFDFSVSSPYLIRSRDPRESSGLINQSEMRILNSLVNSAWRLIPEIQKSRQAECSRPVIVIPRQHTGCRAPARDARAGHAGPRAQHAQSDSRSGRWLN